MKKQLLLIVFAIISAGAFGTTYTVNYAPGPNVNVTCNVGDVIIFNSGTATNTMIFGQPTPVMLPTSTSNSYTVTTQDSAYVMNPSGVQSSGHIYITTTGINTISKEALLFSAFPNPAENELKINVSAKTEASIFSSVGQLIFKQNLEPGNNTVNIDNWTSGVYYLAVGFRRLKVIKQ